MEENNIMNNNDEIYEVEVYHDDDDCVESENGLKSLVGIGAAFVAGIVASKVAPKIASKVKGKFKKDNIVHKIDGEDEEDFVTDEDVEESK